MTTNRADQQSSSIALRPCTNTTTNKMYDPKIIAFVNPKSGGQQGQTVLDQLKVELGEQNVYDLVTDHGPQKGLQENQNVKDLRIITCGGDGTVGWVLSVLDTVQMQYQDSISVGVIPLGTGNDMARFLGYGSGYGGESLAPIVQSLITSEICLLDRWSIDVKPTVDSGTASLKIPQTVLNNYFSFGADAQIALDFHEKRNANPGCYSNRVCNKMAYCCISCRTLCNCRYMCGDIGNTFEIEVDGISINEALLRTRPDAFLILNIASYAAGTNPWDGEHDGCWCARSRVDDDRFTPQSSSDGYLELIAIRNYEFARIQFGRRARRVAQGKVIKLRTLRDLPMEVDGEPFMLGPCQITISRKNQARMMAAKTSQAARQFKTGRL